jgi:hypothetical protein
MRYQGSILDKNEALRLELSAYHVGTLGYVYGYPIVDLLKQKHNQTHRIRDDQKVIAPVNAFYVFPDLRPDNDSGLRAPNNDTLYLNAWLELAQEPVVIHTPDTQDRYFTLSLTNLYSDVTHVGRRVNGTGERYYAIVGPNWNGTLPKEVTPVRMATQTVWVLGRIAVFGANDLTEAKRLGEQFWAVPLSRWRPGLEPATDPVEKALPSAPLDTLEFFAMLNRALRENPQPDGEAALMEQFDQAGFGPHVKFDADELSGAEHDRVALAADLVGDPHDVGDGVLPVAVGAHHVLPGVRVHDVGEAGLERGALAPIDRVADHVAAETGALGEHRAVGVAAAVVDHHDVLPGAGATDGADEVDQPVTGLVGGDEDDHVGPSGSVMPGTGCRWCHAPAPCRAGR